MTKEPNNEEEHQNTDENSRQEAAWFPRPHEHKGRQKTPRPQAQEGQKDA